MPSSFKYQLLPVVIGMLVCLAGCSDELIFTGGEEAAKMVVVASAPTDSAICILVTESQHITEDTFSRPVPNAELRLYVNGGLKETFKTPESGKVISAYRAKSGDSLTLIIRKDGFGKVESSVVNPGQTILLQFDSLTRLGNDWGLRLIMGDDALSDNFYLIELFASRWVYTLHPQTFKRIDSARVLEPLAMGSVAKIFFSDQNIVTSGQKFELFTDMLFNGDNYVLDMNVNVFNLQETPTKGKAEALKVKLRSINEDYYHFLTSLSLNRPIYGGPFSALSQVPGNMDGGYGIFSTYSVTSAVIKLK